MTFKPAYIRRMDRVELAYEYGRHAERRWRDHGSQSPYLVLVTFGRLGDGRWYADLTGYRTAEVHGRGAHVFGADGQGRVLALRLAYRWMRDAGGRWWPTPASFDDRGDPADGLPWVARGGEWLLER